MKVNMYINNEVSCIDKDTKEKTTKIVEVSLRNYLNSLTKDIEKSLMDKVKPTNSQLQVLQRFMGKTFDINDAVKSAFSNKIIEHNDSILAIGSRLIEKIKHFQENMIIEVIEKTE